MESANLHHQHQLQHQLLGSSSLATSTTPSTYTTGSAHAWTQNFTRNGNFNPDCYNGIILNPRQKNETDSLIPPPLNSSMVQDLSFQWNINNAAGNFLGTHSAYDLQLSKIKEDLSDSLPKPTEDSHLSSTGYIKNEQKVPSLSEKLLLNTISSSANFPINGHDHQFSPRESIGCFGSCSIPAAGRSSFSQIYPSINISSLIQPSPPLISSSFDMNLQAALDLLNSTRFCASNFAQRSNEDPLGMYKDSLSLDLDRVRQSNHMPSCSPRKISSTNETEAKRANSLMEPATTQSATKKSRLESRATCPPFKVRKEKLGDRIAALQQLVAPFGKTDTASVLMEAIGYIKFLQNQVETLSVPYMKSARNKTNRTIQAGSNAEDGNDEPKRDLRGRGLCLVPLACMSYVTSDGCGGGGIWPPPNFGGGT